MVEVLWSTVYIGCLDTASSDILDPASGALFKRKQLFDLSPLPRKVTNRRALPYRSSFPPWYPQEVRKLGLMRSFYVLFKLICSHCRHLFKPQMSFLFCSRKVPSIFYRCGRLPDVMTDDLVHVHQLGWPRKIWSGNCAWRRFSAYSACIFGGHGRRDEVLGTAA